MINDKVATEGGTGIVERRMVNGGSSGQQGGGRNEEWQAEE